MNSSEKNFPVLLPLQDKNFPTWVQKLSFLPEKTSRTRSPIQEEDNDLRHLICLRNFSDAPDSADLSDSKQNCQYNLCCIIKLIFSRINTMIYYYPPPWGLSTCILHLSVMSNSGSLESPTKSCRSTTL